MNAPNRTSFLLLAAQMRQLVKLSCWALLAVWSPRMALAVAFGAALLGILFYAIAKGMPDPFAPAPWCLQCGAALEDDDSFDQIGTSTTGQLIRGALCKSCKSAKAAAR